MIPLLLASQSALHFPLAADVGENATLNSTSAVQIRWLNCTSKTATKSYLLPALVNPVDKLSTTQHLSRSRRSTYIFTPPPLPRIVELSNLTEDHSASRMLIPTCERSSRVTWRSHTGTHGLSAGPPKMILFFPPQAFNSLSIRYTI